MQIIATFNVLHDPVFQCSVCTKKISKENRDSRKGCSKPLNKPFSSWRNLVKFKSCPANYYSAYWAMTIDNFRHVDKGLLPFKGSLLDQPSKLVEAYSLIENLKIEHESEVRERLAKKQRK